MTKTGPLRSDVSAHEFGDWEACEGLVVREDLKIPIICDVVRVRAWMFLVIGGRSSPSSGVQREVVLSEVRNPELRGRAAQVDNEGHRKHRDKALRSATKTPTCGTAW